MSEPAKKRKAIHGGAPEEGEENISEADEIAPITRTASILQVSDTLRQALTNEMQELLLKAHELSFEYSTLDCDNITKCPLAKKSKELFKVIKRLNELIKSMSQAQKPY